jgi:hypothetical protein
MLRCTPLHAVWCVLQGTRSGSQMDSRSRGLASDYDDDEETEDEVGAMVGWDLQATSFCALVIGR